MKGLIIEEPWISLILKGKKKWELRSRNTKIRGEIALIRKGSGTVVGTVFLTDSIPRSLAYLSKHQERHHCDAEQLAKYSNGKELHTWVLKGVKRLKIPVPYHHPQGAVIWVTLPDDILTGAR